MLVQGRQGDSRNDILVNEYVRLLDSGIDAAKILVLHQNAYKKSKFVEKFKARVGINFFNEPQIYSFYGLVYNTVLNNWAEIENLIETGSACIMPNLIGLEISQFLFKQAVKESGFKDYNSKINLIHQLFRRNSLITNNGLSQEEVDKKSKILKESFAPDAKLAIDNFKKKTIAYRAFDYIRQVNIFSYIYKNTNYFENIEYLILDDADEITNAELDFIKTLKPSLKQVFIAYDKYGSSRLGFLNTDIKTIENLENLFENEEILNIDDTPKSAKITRTSSFSRRLEMIESALKKITELIENGENPSEITIVSPLTDSCLKFCITETLNKKNINCQFLSGSEKLVQSPCVRNTLSILNLAFEKEIDTFKLRCILTETAGIPVKYCMNLINGYKHNRVLEFTDLGVEEYNRSLRGLLDIISEISCAQMLLSEKVYKIYENLFSKTLNNEESRTFSFFLKQICDFETVFKQYADKRKMQEAIVIQLENSIISENPSFAPEILDNCVVVSTPQKIIDFSLKRKHLFLLDTSSNEWTKDDLGTLYNAWVYQKSWDGGEFTYEDNLKFTTEKTKRACRKLSFLGEEIYDYSSLFDIQGCENQGGIKPFIEESTTNIKDKNINFNFTPRDDQCPVMDYKSGKMAISAVPGAGKTTILLALIIKLLQNNVNSENIFVLTFMESAAKNFKERIKKICPNIEKMPNISTIHGLALRILKENSNFVKAGLDENFEICDDSRRQKIIQELMYRLQANPEDFDKYEKAVSVLKLSGISNIPFVSDIEIKKFLRLYNAYNRYLKDKNVIDYDDMLVLSVKILEENADIAEYYQDMCHYLIEDEAQDSSGVQQKLLNILSKKHGNLIRCGDINQAITTTFTNADTAGFRKFISENKNVEMNHSQRCTKEVYELANRLIDISQTNEYWKNAFYNIKMHPVSNRNPESENAVNAEIFESFQDERSYILENIRKIFRETPEASIAVLVRNNSQIEDYSEFLFNYGYNVITRNDALKEQPVFSLIYSIIKFCTHPWNNEYVVNCAQCLKKQKLLKLSDSDIEVLKSLKEPFILKTQESFTTLELSRLWWDLDYWLCFSHRSFPDRIDELALKIGAYYYNSEIEKSNVNMVALLLKRTSELYKNTDILMERLESMAQRPIASQFRFFTDEENDEAQKEKSGCIQIMTYHKSKGDEFDCVFIPELTEERLHLRFDKIKINSKERFIEAIKALNCNYAKKNEEELKIFQIEENLRLLYVAITRAQRKLFITSAKQYKVYSRLKNTEPSPVFNELTRKIYNE